MRFALIFSFLSLNVLLAGCGILGSSQTLSASSDAAGLIAYQQVRSRSAASSPLADPTRRPSALPVGTDYPFENAIPFFPRNAGEYVSSDFGWRNLWGRMDFHCGVDVVADIGTPVRAVTDGEITLSRSAGRNGGVVMYNDGLQYTYWHMIPDRRLVEGGQVRAGQRIGRLADWGSNTHIHYGVYITGGDSHPNAREETNCVDPMALAYQGIF